MRQASAPAALFSPATQNCLLTMIARNVANFQWSNCPSLRQEAPDLCRILFRDPHPSWSRNGVSALILEWLSHTLGCHFSGSTPTLGVISRPYWIIICCSTFMFLCYSSYICMLLCYWDLPHTYANCSVGNLKENNSTIISQAIWRYLLFVHLVSNTRADCM